MKIDQRTKEVTLTEAEYYKLVNSPASEDLEDASRNYADNEEYGDDVYFAIKAAFKAGANWQKKKDEEELLSKCVDIKTAYAEGLKEGKRYQKEQMITKACDWLKENLLNHTYAYNSEVGIGMAEFLKDFRKAMED